MKRVNGSPVDRSRVDWSPVDGCHYWMNRCWVDRSRVDRCRLVGWARMSHSLVFDISHIATVTGNISMVVNNLNAAIRQGHSVVSSHQGTIRALILAKVDARVLINDTILKSIGLGWFSITVGSRVVNGCRVNWSWVVGCRCVWSRQVSSIGSSGQGSDEGGGFGKHVGLLLSVELLD